MYALRSFLFCCLFFLSHCTPYPDTGADDGNKTIIWSVPYNVTYVSLPLGEKAWNYIIVPPLQNVSVNYFGIDYFSIQAVDLGSRPLHAYLNFGLKKSWNATRSQIECDGVEICLAKTTLRRGDYTLYFHNPHAMSTSYIRYSVQARDKEMTMLAKAVVLFFLAGVMMPLLTVFLLMLLCYVKARQYLVQLWN